MSAPVTSLDKPTKIPFKNVHTKSVPAFGVMQITGSVVEDDVRFLTCTQPGTTLGTEFAINGASLVLSGDKGVCYREGDLRVAFDTGSPAAGEAWGVRANQWSLSKGYPPLITVDAVVSAMSRILHGRFAPFGSVLGASAFELPAISGGVPGAQSATVQVWTGTAFAASTPGMVFEGCNISGASISAGTLTQFVAANGLWIAAAEQTPAIVTVDDPEGASGGTAVGPVDHCLWSGTLTAVVGAAGYCSESPFLTGQAVWIVVIDRPQGSTSGGAQLVVGDRYLAHKVSANHTIDGDSRPLYAIRKGSLGLVRFELTADLVYGTDPSSDNGVMLTYHDGAYHADGSAIRVFDWTVDATSGGGTYGTWSGKAPLTSPARSGYQGWAIFKPDSNRYEIVWLEQTASLISFRLYQQLTTANASQSNCTVVAFWNGRDPDPADAKITVYNLATDYSGIYKFSGDANAVGYAAWNEKLARYQIIGLEGDGQRWLLVKNSSGFTIPANSVAGVTGVTRDAHGHTNKRNLLTLVEPGTTLLRSYVITGYADIADAAVGVACGFDGPMEAAFDTGTPANGESWGPKPGQFTLSKGFPGFIVDGLNSDNSLAVVRFEPITEWLAQASSNIAASGSSSSYKIMVGTLGSETDSGLSVPSAYNRGEIVPNTGWCDLKRESNGWELVARPGQWKARIISGTLGGTLGAGGSVTCSVSAFRQGLSPGSSLTVFSDESMLTGTSGKRYKAYYSPVDDKYYFFWVEC